MIYHFCTLFDKNYLTRGLALNASLLKHSPPFILWVLCMDQETLEILKKLRLPNLKTISLKQFEDPALLKVKPTRSTGEYCWTCTPSLPLYIFKTNPKISSIAYLDSDLFFFSSPQPLYYEMDKKSVLIIPHRIVPWKKAKEKKVGKFNVGMLIFKNDAAAKTVLKWWREKCLEWCYNRVEKNRMGDQKYLDQFPKRFKGVCISKNLGACLANWNIRQYSINKVNQDIFVNNDKLIFYHYQWFDLFENRPPLPPLKRGPYTDPTNYRDFLFKPYTEALFTAYKLVRTVEPSYALGLSSRLPIAPYLKDSLLQARDEIKALIWK